MALQYESGQGLLSVCDRRLIPRGRFIPLRPRLCENSAPDFKTIADFRKDNGVEIRLVIRFTLVICLLTQVSAAFPVQP